jgi:phosphoribosylformylglycinamidine synthase subunit PurL
MTETAITPEVVKELGLLPEEYKMITNILGRVPNFDELSIYSALWSEHTSYKNSIKWLKKLPHKSDAVLFETGTENAGVVDIGNGLACVFKMESHNHPCAVEPYRGAASGVGGINRDIFTMGARPVAQLNSLRFGALNNPRAKWLMKEVVKGIGDYSNAFGVPVVSGEVFFDESYNQNPVINAMSVGIVNKGQIIPAAAKGVGNPVYIIGALTGRDGIHGAVFASGDITEHSVKNIASVQVGDPFTEKLLLEALLELNNTGSIVGMQDLGASGVVCSAAEMAVKAHHGMEISLDKIPVRQAGMEAREIMLSESQERMLVVIKKGMENLMEEISEKWDLNIACIGEVIKDDRLFIKMNGNTVADIPASSLVSGSGAPAYEREQKEPSYHKELKKFNIDDVPEPENMKEVFWEMLRNPNLASKKWVSEQFDTMVMTSNLTTNFPSDAGVVNLKGSNTSLMVTTDCNPRYVYADPEKGTEIAVAEASRNIICSGGEPLAITNCLNFGNPYDPEVYWQFLGTIRGMGKACLKFNTPVTGGNVSFYNQADAEGKTTQVYPTPTIGMIGINKDKNCLMNLSFKNKGDMIYLIGKSENDIASSEYLVSYHKIRKSPAPHFNLDFEHGVQEVVKSLIKHHLIHSAHDISDGGLLITLAESAMVMDFGFDITSDAEVRLDAFLFGEAQSRIVVSVSPTRETEFLDFMLEQDVPFSALGHVTKEELRVDDISYGFISDVKRIYEQALEEAITK